MWESSQSMALGLDGSDKNQWDQLVNGLRWYRWNTIDKRRFYVFRIESPEQVRSVGVDPEDIAEFANENYGDWHEAEWWTSTSNFRHTSYFWKDELAQQPVVEAQPPAPPIQQPPPPPAVAAAPQPGVNIGQRLPDPTVTSNAPAQYWAKGAVAWAVRMTVQNVQQQPSWIIQKVRQTDPDEDITFWEAFPVPANQAQAANQDIFQANFLKHSRGTLTVAGLMQHHNFNGGDPPGMQKGASEHSDNEQFSALQPPPFWTADDGTSHNLTFNWGLFDTTVTTVPDSGGPIQKEHWRDIDASK